MRREIRCRPRGAIERRDQRVEDKTGNLDSWSGRGFGGWGCACPKPPPLPIDCKAKPTLRNLAVRGSGSKYTTDLFECQAVIQLDGVSGNNYNGARFCALQPCRPVGQP